MDDGAIPSVVKATVSTKGQVILPKAVRDRLRWTPGTQLIVEDRPEGVVLRRAAVRRPTRLEDVAGMLRGGAPTLSVAEMDAAVDEMFARDPRG